MHSNGPVLDDEILADPAVIEAIENEGTVERSYDIVNTDRAALGRLGGAVARLHGDNGFAGTVSIILQVGCQSTSPWGMLCGVMERAGLSLELLQGSAGQSFAPFLVSGIKVKLTGEANDYVCKGIAGGEVTIVPPPASPFPADEASLVGNTCLYGATGGRLFVNGRAGGSTSLFNLYFCIY